MRQILIFFAAIVALCGSIVATLATQQNKQYDLRGYQDAAQTHELPFRVNRLGVNVSLQQYGPSELAAQLDLMESAGIYWLRQELYWPDLLGEDDTLQWDVWDPIVRAIAGRPQLELVLVLRGVPQELRDPLAQEHIHAPPADPKTFAEFAGAVAERYGDRVDYYQIWDEPNLTAAWGGLSPRPAAYAALLEASYMAIHAFDDEAVVLAAALAPTTETGPENISEWRYLDALYRLGAAMFWDGVAAKPYGFESSPYDRTVQEEVLNVSRIVRLRELMLEHDDPYTAIWASNWGWNSLPENWTGSPSIWGQVNSNTRVQHTLGLLQRAEREWPWLAGMMLYHWQPIADAQNPIWGFALLDAKGTPTELLNALIIRHQQDESLATNGLYPPETPYAQYQGVWTFGELGADIGWVNDSRLTFEFSGSDLSLVLRQGDYVAYLYPEINGNPANATPKDNQGMAYVVLTHPQRQTAVKTVPIARHLPLAPHELSVKADEGHDQWALVGYGVSDGDLAAPYDRQIWLAWFSTLVAGIAVIATGSQVPWQRIIHSQTKLASAMGDATHVVVSGITSLILLAGLFFTWGDGIPALIRRDTIILPLSIITGGLLYIEIHAIVTIIAALALLWLFYHRLDIGLMLVVLWAPFFLFPVTLYLYAFPMAEILLLIAVAAWVIQHSVMVARHYRENHRFPKVYVRFSTTDWIVVTYVLFSALSLAWTQYFEPAITDLRVMVLEPALFYMLLRTTVHNLKTLQQLTFSLLVAALAVSVIGLGMYLAGFGVITAEGEAKRLAGVYGSPNNVALFLGRALPFALAYVLLTRRWLPSYLFGVTCLLICGLVLGLTQSAGGIFIGVPVALMLVLLLALRKRAFVPIMLMIIIFAVMFGILLQFPRFARVLDFSSGTNFFRLRVWESAINAIQDYPITGLGLDQFLYYFRGEYIRPDAWQEPELSHPHNFVLDFWVRLGVSGVGIFLAWQLAFWQQVYTLYKDRLNLDKALPIIVGAAGAMANLVAHGAVDNSVFVNDLVLIFMFLLVIPQNVRQIQKTAREA